MGADQGKKIGDMIPVLQINNVIVFPVSHFCRQGKAVHNLYDQPGQFLVFRNDLQMIIASGPTYRTAGHKDAPQESFAAASLTEKVLPFIFPGRKDLEFLQCFGHIAVRYHFHLIPVILF